MAWTSPTSRSYDDLITSTIWNTDLVDNLIYLKSKADRSIWPCKVFFESQALVSGDGKYWMNIPPELDGADITAVAAFVYAASSSGAITIQIRNATQTQDVLSTELTIDESENDSSTAATPAVINSATDDMTAFDSVFIDMDGIGTDTTGLFVFVTYYLT